MRPRIRVGIIEDDPNLRVCLETEIGLAAGLRCVGSWERCEEAFLVLAKIYPDVLLLDLVLPGMSGVEGLKVVKERWPRLKVLVFSGHCEEEKILPAFEAGADGYLVKAAPRQKLVAAIEAAYEGGSPLSEQVGEVLIGFVQARHRVIRELSQREREVVCLWEQGGSYKQIAHSLNISESTVKAHMRSFVCKSGALSSAHAAFIRRHANF